MRREQSYTEHQLVSLLRGGSQLAFERLFESYSQKLYRFSLSYLKSETEAEEIVQDVFLKLWENRKQLKSDTSFQSYVFTIAFNAIRKHFNKKAREKQYTIQILESLASEHASVESYPDYELLVAKLGQLIGQMPERRREIFIKRKKEGISVSDIALTMNISPKTVENQITEAMNFLKKEFEKDRLSGQLFLFLMCNH